MPTDTAELARFLIGKMLVRALAEGVAGGRIVETEAYVLGDPASHAYRGLTPRNRALYLERGHAYVYLAYGVSFMLNVASETSGNRRRRTDPGDRADHRRRDHGTESRRDAPARSGARPRTAVRRPGDRSPADGIDLCQAGPLWLGSDDRAADEIGQSVRIGITRAADRTLRFYVRGSRFVSGPRALNP